MAGKAFDQRSSVSQIDADTLESIMFTNSPLTWVCDVGGKGGLGSEGGSGEMHKESLTLQRGPAVNIRSHFIEPRGMIQRSFAASRNSIMMSKSWVILLSDILCTSELCEVTGGADILEPSAVLFAPFLEMDCIMMPKDFSCSAVAFPAAATRNKFVNVMSFAAAALTKPISSCVIGTSEGIDENSVDGLPGEGSGGGVCVALRPEWVDKEASFSRGGYRASKIDASRNICGPTSMSHRPRGWVICGGD